MNKIYTNIILVLSIIVGNGIIKAQTISDVPPAGTIRTAAEWEEIQAL